MYELSILIGGAFLGIIVAGLIILWVARGDNKQVAGEDIASGELVYMHRDGKWYKSKPASFDELNRDQWGED